MQPIGIIGAMSAEVNGLIARLENHECEKIGGIEFHTGRIFSKDVVISQCGVGKVFAAMCCEAMIIRYSPKLVVNTGVGGAIAEGLSCADIVVADSLCQHDMDTSALGEPLGIISGIDKIYFETDERASEVLLGAAEKLGITAKRARIASGDLFVASAEKKKYISETFSASVCEMEGAAVAQVAFVNKTPFTVVRAISDSADGNSPMDFPTFLKIAAKNSESMTLALIEGY